MRYFFMDELAKQPYNTGIDMLPELETETFADDSVMFDLETDFWQGMDDWWDNFIADDFVSLY